ncbi:hypothetical protein T12_10496 [Trichinella patagoniensis]|uniref:Uncharacterized protein n=1 Tax=Trichinella patagoniensis TaxID=990121 RepID=A0A0V0YSC7_9BILA|nr:hypothetical protein T12_10496 [Trichinella patagoniensis]
MEFFSCSTESLLAHAGCYLQRRLGVAISRVTAITVPFGKWKT